MKSKKFISVLLAALMLVSVFAIAASAEDEDPVNGYEVYVNGQKLSETVTEIACGSGTASYDADSGILTLDNAQITTFYEYQPQYQALIYSAEKDLEIELVGENTIVGQDPYDDGIDAAGGCNITITGEGTLDISNVYYGFYIGSWDAEGGDLCFNGANVKVAAKMASGIWVNHDIDFIDSEVSVSIESKFYNGIVSNTDGTITVTDSELSVTAPGCGILLGNSDSSSHTFVLNSGKVTINAGTAIYCEPDRDTGDINGDIFINGGNLTVEVQGNGTNIESINLEEGVTYLEGTSLLDGGRIVIGEGEGPTEQPTTEAPTTAEPTTAEPTTETPTTAEPTTAEPTTEAPTTAEPTTAEPTTEAPTTAEPTTEAPTTKPATAKAVSLTYKRKSIKAAGVFTLKAKNAGSAKVSYKTSNKKVATVTAKGVVTGLQRGTSVITVTVGSKKLTCKVTVTNNPVIKIGSKSLSTKKTYKIKKGKTLTLKLYRRVNSIKNTYLSNKKSVAKVISKAKVNKVEIKGLKLGKATITIKINGVRTFKVKVNVVKK